MELGESAAGEQRATLQSPVKITLALTVVTIVVVVGNAVTSTIAAVAVGAAAGAAAGIGMLQSLWEAKIRTGPVAVAVTAVAGGLAGTTAAILQSLLGAQSLTGSSVNGAMAGAAIVTVVRAQLQWAIETIQWVTDTIQCVVNLVQKFKASLPAAKITGGSGLAAAILYQALKEEAVEASSIPGAFRPASSGAAVSGPPSSGPGPSGPGASGAAVSGPPSSGPGPSGPGASGAAVSGPPSSGPGPSGPGASGAAVSGPPSSGPGPSGPGASGAAVSGPPSSGPGPSGPGASGAAVSDTASSGPGPSGPGASGSAVSGPPSSGPGPSGPGASGSGPSGPAPSGPAASGPAESGSAASGAMGTGSAASGPGASGSAASGAAGLAAAAGSAGVGVAAGVMGGILGGLLAGAGSENNGSKQKSPSKTQSAEKGEKDDGPAGVSPDQHIQEKTEREKIEQLFQRLTLDKNKGKLKIVDVLQVTAHNSCVEEKLVWSFIQKLLMINYRARFTNVKDTNEQHHTQQTDSESPEDNSDIVKAMSYLNKGTGQSERIHPMDVQMAVFLCADGFLKQLMVTKLSQCQYALPLLVPDPVTKQIEFPLWTFRQINKSWKMRNTNNETISKSQPIYKAETPMVFFFRFASVSSSKSQLMNSLINEKHNTFFHRNCPGSSRTRVLMDGVVEIAWFCPSGTNDDKFTDCVAFCNLHGDAGDHEKQLQILTEMASVNVVLLAKLDRNDRSATIIQNLYTNRKPLICLFTEDESTVTELKKGKFKIGLKYRNQSDVSEELRRIINECLSETSSTFRLEDVSKHSDIRVDEEEDEDCRRGREAAQQMMSLLEKKDLTEIKETFLPHQGKLWHQWSQKNKELHRPRGDEIEMDIRRKHTELQEIREQQHKFKISEFMKFFIKEINSDVTNKMYFFKWLRILLDEHRTVDRSALHHKWSAVVKPKENHDESEQLLVGLNELEKISEELQAAAFGLEHIMREIGQIYESCSSVKKNKKDLQVHFSSLPSLAAEMMISGFPLELMDGDAAHVPVIWISAVLDELVQKLGDQRVFVLSVLGIQSSGKSTMLNAMFGLEFAVSAGRCTRGAFMQLVRVSEEMKTQLNFDYILVVDTEGLRALKLSGRSTRDHDNELATFVIGIGNLTLINIFGENPSEMQDILQIVVQAFMRMKRVRLNPSCVFVHQNVSDVTAEEKNMEGRRRLQETLDEMTKLAAKDEVCDAECFSDVIRFDVQKDVKYFVQLWEGSSLMSPPNPDYCENIQELKESVISHAAKSHGIMLKDLTVRVEDLWKALLSERFVFSFRNSLEISAYRKLETEYSKWSWSLRSAMMETENKLHNQIENEVIHEVVENDLQGELKKTSEQVKKYTFEFFEKDKYKHKSLDIKIKDVQENIVRETKRKLNETHVNTLHEKSRELAFKPKYRENDEETLKKEFDLFWKQYLNKIITDTPIIKDIDIIRDVKLLLYVYESAPVDHWRESRDIFTVTSYADYVQLKKYFGLTGAIKNAIRSAKEILGKMLSLEDEAQIRLLVTDILLKTEKLIESFNISKMGYNISSIQQLTGYIKARVTGHQEGQVRYVFKNEFFVDLVLSIFKRANKMIIDQHRRFREANDPVKYVERRREEYYSIFQIFCHEATSTAVFGEIICQKLKEPIEQSVYKKTARDLADEMRSNCESLNGNRSNLEKHILETLAEEEDFDKYMNYIHNPRDHFKSFIRDEVSIYITAKFSDSVLPKMMENTELLQQKIMKAAHESTEHVQEKRGDVGLWLMSFTQQLSDELIFSEEDFCGVKHDDIDVDFKFLEDVIRKELSTITSYIHKANISNKKMDFRFRPDELLIDHFCQCCWVQCPFCGATCTNTIENHPGDHSVAFHRVIGIKGHRCFLSQNFCVDICTNLVASDKDFLTLDGLYPYNEYRKAGGVYAKWSITPECFELPYWKWFVCRFKKDLENHYKKEIVGKGEIPNQWKRLRKQDAIESLDKYF
ncbi:interferon-induced very large GTPase 1-like [Carassius auratus]|uniref:Interferon-induced very large GTPase 1-like n=1 Tax=Carassius auratus TaxID=7957 RepID=A0A6P6MHB4_CARAU|nr:interferon-induced very large GTPase 1-like [Carassius auratus]